MNYFNSTRKSLELEKKTNEEVMEAITKLREDIQTCINNSIERSIALFKDNTTSTCSDHESNEILEDNARFIDGFLKSSSEGFEINGNAIVVGQEITLEGWGDKYIVVTAIGVDFLLGLVFEDKSHHVIDAREEKFDHFEKWISVNK